MVVYQEALWKGFNGWTKCARFTFAEKLVYKGNTFDFRSSMKVTLDELQTFATVVDTGSITAAAEQLDQTVSGASRSSKRSTSGAAGGAPAPALAPAAG